MLFEGPELRDYDNVVSLNAAYLSAIRKGCNAGLECAAEPLVARLAGLDERQASRLAETPFLLFSFRECDDGYWDHLLGDAVPGDLFQRMPPPDLAMLTSAALGFIWQLANRNPYALRLFCGATLYWCERIGELTFYRLLNAVRCVGDVPVLRLAGNQGLWRKLLDEGTSRDTRLRQAAQFAALQTVLTDPSDNGQVIPLRLAARRSKPPGLSVADNTRRR